MSWPVSDNIVAGKNGEYVGLSMLIKLGCSLEQALLNYLSKTRSSILPCVNHNFLLLVLLQNRDGVRRCIHKYFAMVSC